MMRNPGLAMLTALAIALFMAVAILTDMASAQTATPTTTPTPTATATANPAAISNEMISCWSMNETAGVRADAFGYNHLTDNNTVGYVGSGSNGAAAYFVAANSEFLSIPDNASVSITGQDDFTFVFTFKLDFIAPTYNVLVSKSGSTSDLLLVDYYINVSQNGALQFLTGNGTNVQADVITPDGAIVAGVKYHAVIIYNPEASSGRYVMHVNNVKYASTTQPARNVLDSTAPFCIGAYCTSASTFRVTGWIDDVSLYDRDLTNAEAAWLYNSGYGRSCAEIIGARGTPTATPTTAPTATPNPAMATVALSTSAALQLERRVSYGDISTVAAIGLLGILVVAYMLIRLQVGR